MARLALGDLAGAEAEARRSLEPHPDFAYSRWVLGLALHGMGRHDEGTAELRALTPEGGKAWSTLTPWES